MLRLLVAAAVIFGVGSCVGHNTADPKVEFVKVPQTKYVMPEAPEPKTVQVLPDECIKALDQAQIIDHQGNGLYAKSDKMLEITAHARLLLAEGKTLDPIDDEIRELQSHTTANLYAMSAAMYQYQRYYTACQKELQ